MHLGQSQFPDKIRKAYEPCCRWERQILADDPVSFPPALQPAPGSSSRQIDHRRMLSASLNPPPVCPRLNLLPTRLPSAGSRMAPINWITRAPVISTSRPSSRPDGERLSSQTHELYSSKMASREISKDTDDSLTD